MRPVDKDCPCSKDCPERSATCRTTCERGIAYYAKQHEKYAEREKKRELAQATCSYLKDRNASVRREVKRKRGK